MAQLPTDSVQPLFLKQKLSHVYWLGGSPCSGKTSIAEALAAAQGLTLYNCDEAYFRHAKRITPEGQPTYFRVTHLSWEEIWMRPVDQQIAEEIEVYREQFPFILGDLLALPASQPILAEGAALLPEFVAPLLTDAHRAVWVVPTAEFQRYHYSQREWAKEIAKTCSDPARAFENWMQRDIGYARHVRQAAENRGLDTLVVNGERSIAENTAWVKVKYRLNPKIERINQ